MPGVLGDVARFENSATEPSGLGKARPRLSTSVGDTPNRAGLQHVHPLMEFPGPGEIAVKPVIDGEVVHDAQGLWVRRPEHFLVQIQGFLVERERGGEVTAGA